MSKNRILAPLGRDIVIKLTQIYNDRLFNIRNPWLVKSSESANIIQSLAKYDILDMDLVAPLFQRVKEDPKGLK